MLVYALLLTLDAYRSTIDIDYSIVRDHGDIVVDVSKIFPGVGPAVDRQLELELRALCGRPII